MKTIIGIVTKDIVDKRVMQAAQAQGCEIMVNVLEPIKMHDDYEKNRYMNVVRNQNELRAKLLAIDADAFLWVENDVVLPPDALQKFLAADKSLAGGWYKMISGNNWVAGTLVEEGILHLFTSPKPTETPVDLMGLGCCFMKREVLEAVDFDAGVDSYMRTSTGAMTFHGNCFNFTQRAKKFSPVMLDIICTHLQKNYKVEAPLFEAIGKYLASRPAIETADFIVALKPLVKE